MLFKHKIEERMQWGGGGNFLNKKKLEFFIIFGP